ncbi:ceramidase domain-containing protein [Spirosoma panaciterrae]|uniref:ceramidase domain-containing protein n=1 Tax=Spirosoma panaciterrae TaxID=496058 RepID=UPI00036A592F|nr:ceramidase domain-containing protein [Spirosoma panaciterrae]
MPLPLMTRMLLRSATATFWMFAGWINLNTLLKGDVWAGMQVSKSALTVEYCEFNHTDRFFHQPMNTYSNLAYFFLGILVLQIAVSDYKKRDLQSRNRLKSFPLLSALAGICFIYLSFGSAFFHASLTYIGQRVDMNGTYGLTLTLVGIALYQVLHKVRFSESAKQWSLVVLVVLIILFLKISLLIPSGILLPALILSLLLLTGINYFQFRKERYGWVAIASFILIVVAIKIRTLDVHKFGCNPHSLVQGHAIWHLLTGLSSFCSYAFFRFTRSDS